LRGELIAGQRALAGVNMSQTHKSRSPASQPGQKSRIRSKEVFGILEWFHFEDYEFVERTLTDLRRLDIDHLRTGISWADWMREDGPEWIAWLFERIAQEDLELLPCFLYTPPSEGEVERTSSPPKNLRSYADFVGEMIAQFGDHFEYVELWNEPNNFAEWDFTRDPEFSKFAEMIIYAANWAQQQGKTTVLGGMSPIDPGWLEHIIGLGVLDYIDVLGIHGFPGTWEKNWTSWQEQVHEVDRVLDGYGFEMPLWITEVGYSTRNYREYQQLEVFLDALDAPAARMYWYGLYDLADERPSILGFHLDEREYHCGLKRADGREKLLYRLLCDAGEDAVREVCEWPTPQKESPSDAALITGGAGFIGSNLAYRLLSEGRDVVVFDNLSRPGVESNLRWLTDDFDDNLWVVTADLRDQHALGYALRGVSEVFHFAGQTAVTTSLDDPIDDFTANARATLNLLEGIRRSEHSPSLVFTSTNKVYGNLGGVELEERATRYVPADADIDARGIGEDRRVQLSSPYGCSKGAADQYVLDYAKTFGVKACVFRMSCIYGPRQMGTEDQGWIAHFLLRALHDEQITIFGDGKQVRDVLFVDDLVDAFLRTREHMDELEGRAFNIGGGPDNTMSLLELVDFIEDVDGRSPRVEFDRWRPGDQRYYVSNIASFREATGWEPSVGRRRGVERLYGWLEEFSSRQSRDSGVASVEMTNSAAEPLSSLPSEGSR
jgi:CDP-paratose 2-epimerase